MSANTITTRRIRQVTRGTIPAGAMQLLGVTSCSFDGTHSRGKVDSVTSHGGTEDNPLENFAGTGSLEAPYRHRVLEEVEEEGMGFELTGAYDQTVAIAAVAATNRLTCALNWPAGMAVGGFYLVDGLTTNGGLFVIRVTALNSATDITADADWKTLVNESEVASVRVVSLGHIQTGKTLLYATYEQYNETDDWAEVYKDVATNGLTWTISRPSHVKLQAKMVIGNLPTTDGEQLANASTAEVTTPTYTSSGDVFEEANPGVGIGFRHNGALVDIGIKSIEFMNEIPWKAEDDTVGTYGPSSVFRDGQYTSTLKITFRRSGADAQAFYESLLPVGGDGGAPHSIGFGLVNSENLRELFYFPELQPEPKTGTGAKTSGQETVEVMFKAKYNATYGHFRHTFFPAIAA